MPLAATTMSTPLQGQRAAAQRTETSTWNGTVLFTMMVEILFPIGHIVHRIDRTGGAAENDECQHMLSSVATQCWIS